MREENDSMSNDSCNTVNIFVEGSPGANMGVEADMPVCGSCEEYAGEEYNIDLHGGSPEAWFEWFFGGSKK